jgi:hypothetical protein
MPRRRRSRDEDQLSHRDLLDALFEALEIEGQEHREYMRDMYFATIEAAAEESASSPGEDRD